MEVLSIDLEDFVLLTVAFIVFFGGIWNSWIHIAEDGFSARRPTFFEFWALPVENAFRVLLLKRPLSYKDKYPHYFSRHWLNSQLD